MVHTLTTGFYKVNTALCKDRSLFSYAGKDIYLQLTLLSSCTQWKITFYHVRCHLNVLCRTADLIRKTDNFANITNNCSKSIKVASWTSAYCLLCRLLESHLSHDSQDNNGNHVNTFVLSTDWPHFYIGTTDSGSVIVRNWLIVTVPFSAGLSNAERGMMSSALRQVVVRQRGTEYCIAGCVTGRSAEPCSAGSTFS